MKLETIPTAKLDRARALLSGIARHRKVSPTTPTDGLYYELVSEYLENIVQARELGKKIAAHSVLVPPELFVALDMVPMHLEMVCTLAMIVLKEQEEFLAQAKAYGLAPEVCSTHRAIAAAFTQGWAPSPDIVVWNNQVCDNTVKSNELVVERCLSQAYYMDVPYRFDERGAHFLAAELEELATRLEGVAGKRLDRDRLLEVLAYSRRMMELAREVHQLRMAVPCPSPNQLGSQLLYIGWYLAGTPQGVRFFETARDELKARVEAGRGIVPQENYRLLSLFIPPGIHWKLLRWLERQHGAVFVAEPYCTHWGEFDWDDAQPFLTLARRSFAHPVSREMHGPVGEGVIQDAVDDARAARAEGALYWAHIGCRQACAVIRPTKDALVDRVGVPLLVLDIDLNDPTFVTEEELKEKLEGFLETLSERK